ncbi:MAG: hypothetical protein HKN23_18520 [Verrucomicrobiales bacterium]|nr:hypothetical protein [Verrucomicrobiales bacterium]
MNDEVWAAQNVIDFTVPGTEYTAGDQLKITWYDGNRTPNANADKSHVPKHYALPRSGSLIIGEEGTLVIPHVGAPRLYPEEKFAGKIEMADGQNHYHGWVDGALKDEQPSDGFEYGARLTEAVLLGNIAVRFKGDALEWDSENLKITAVGKGNPDPAKVAEANKWVRREYRDGWNIAEV